MAESRGRFEWSQTAEILAMLYNAHRDAQKCPPRTAEDFSPYPREGRPAGAPAEKMSVAEWAKMRRQR